MKNHIQCFLKKKYSIKTILFAFMIDSIFIWSDFNKNIFFKSVFRRIIYKIFFLLKVCLIMIFENIYNIFNT